jgi:histidine triad (HIT) family protein
MPSIFSKIVAGEIPCFKIAEDEHHLAFLDIFPLAKGHILVIPKKEVDYLFDLPTEDYQALWAFAQKVAHAQRQVISCERIGVAVIGLEVPHAHIHLVPINGVTDIDFSRPKLQFSNDEMRTLAEEISQLF